MARSQAVTSDDYLHSGVLRLVFLSLPLAQTFVMPGVSVADLSLTAAALVLAGQHVRRRSLPHIPAWWWCGLVLAAWSAASGVALAETAELPFSGRELTKSLAKLLLYLGGSLFVSDAAWRVGPRRWSKWLLAAAVFHAVVGLSSYSVMQMKWPPLFHSLWAAESSAYTLRFSEPFVRLRGLAAEPSYLGFFLTLALFVPLLADPERRLGWRHALVAIALMLTLSLSIYGFAAGAVLVVMLRQPMRRVAFLQCSSLTAAALLVTVAVSRPVRTSFRVGLLERTASIVTGAVGRAEVKRLAGSWAAALAMTDASPLLGVGLGNYDVALGAVLDRIDPTLEMSPADQGWTVPTYVFATLGWVGLGLFIVLALFAWRNNWAAAVLFLLAACSDGTFLGATFWVFYTLLALVWSDSYAASADEAADRGSAAAATVASAALADPRATTS